jgi:hypothetical protein
MQPAFDLNDPNTVAVAALLGGGLSLALFKFIVYWRMQYIVSATYSLLILIFYTSIAAYPNVNCVYV